MSTSTGRITPHDRDRYVEEARRLRAAELDRILGTIGRALARLVGKVRLPRGRRPGFELPWGARPL